VKIYRLFSEWREVRVIGESLGEALARTGKLREPARFEDGVKVSDGELRTIFKIHACPENPSANSTRGGESYVRALVEIEGGEIRQIDARLEEVVGQ